MGLTLISALVIREPGDAASHVATNPSASGSNVNNNNNSGTPEPYPRHHPDYLVPITNILRIMKRILPPNVKVSEEVKTTIQECLSEYIHFITGEANERCHCEQRKTIIAEDLLYACARLGFSNYIGPLTLFLERYRQNEAAKNIIHGDASVRRTTYFPDAQGPPPLLTSTPPLLPPMNLTFQVGEDHQGFFINPALMLNDLYFQNVRETDHGDRFDVVGSSSNLDFPALAPFSYGFYTGASSPPGSYPYGHGPNHGQ
ncbi:nuclear transcription factor Y subunit B-6-like [Coffea eugenioides]|uniref:nuclear transcription factor Y subunit B-6-like n=1 Tax=Coffea eugenioides TaxID=49369 RepID=UPI000F60792C|nr:nuclear transcription factor Y subunit B-6-like [Coffea eugenioides]